MESIKSYFSFLKSGLVLFLLILFPLFFLPITPEFFATNKMYFLAFGSLLLVLVSTIELVVTRKFVWKTSLFINVFVLIVITFGLSILIASPNKIQAIFNPNFGLITITSLSIFAFYLSKKNAFKLRNFILLLSASALVLAVSTIIFFFQPFKTANLPVVLQFLKNQFFSAIGSSLDLVIFLGFFVLYAGVSIVQTRKRKRFPFFVALIALTGAGFILLCYGIVTNKISLLLPPFNLSWYAAVEILKQPLSAFFGIGIDNFSSMFTRVKDFAYNQSPLWNIYSFNISRSAFLHIMTETGLFGILGFILLFIMMIKKSFKKDTLLFLSTIYLLVVFLLFPLSIVSLFLLFVLVSQFSANQAESQQSSTFDFTNLLPFYVALVLIGFVFIGASGYFLVQMYSSSYYLKKSLDLYAKNDGKGMYENMQKSIIINPYNEQARINFSQANLLIANNIASLAQGTDAEGKPKQLTESERQTIAQAVQAAINEAKAAASLNPQKASLWENLAAIYRAVITVAQGADAWTVSAYQRSIVLDPQNPVYRLNLGGVYYMLGSFNEAVKIFDQVVALKPDWANGHYNLAWALFQNKEYPRAVSEMQNVLLLVNPKQNRADYDRANQDMAEFKKKLPVPEEATKEAVQQKNELIVPTPIEKQNELQPKITLPKTASPEAKP
jgi:Flp pilus assembly protein TadD